KLAAHVEHLVVAVGHLHPIYVSRVEEPLEVRVEPKDRRAAFCVVATDAFKDAGSVIHHVTHHVYPSSLPGNELTVVPHNRSVLLFWQFVLLRFGLEGLSLTPPS